jgi:hypothetical protein
MDNVRKHNICINFCLLQMRIPLVRGTIPFLENSVLLPSILHKSYKRRKVTTLYINFYVFLRMCILPVATQNQTLAFAAIIACLCRRRLLEITHFFACVPLASVNCRRNAFGSAF